MTVLLKVVSFSVALTLVFTLVANTLPQIEGEAPKQEVIELGGLTMESYVALGKTLFSGKGTCSLCHNNLGRAPDLLAINVGEISEQRLQESSYKGAAQDVENYLRESMVEPDAYVVKGFGKKGSNDSESPMPNVAKAPIQLSTVEIDAIVAFLQSKDGHDITVALPKEGGGDAVQEQKADKTAKQVAETSPEALIQKHGCAACHTLLATQSPVGPNLNDVGSRLTPEQIRQGIIAPNAEIAKGFAPNMMPADFADKMTARELEMLVEFLRGRTDKG